MRSGPTRLLEMRIVRDAFRGLARNLGFTAAVVLSLAIGVGANAAVFAVASALLLRPLPYPDADRLAILWNRSPGIGITEDWFSTAQYFDIQATQRDFESIGIAIGANYSLTGDGEPERVGTLRVSSSVLTMLGARAAVGRVFGPEDDITGRSGTALLGHATWQRRYGGDPAAVGRSIVLNGQSHEIVGVLAPGFDIPREVMPTLGGAEHAEVLLPLPLDAEAARVRNREDYNILAKLRKAVGVAAVQAELDALTARLRLDFPAFYPPNGGLTFSVVPLRDQVVGDVRRALLVLVASVALVLLIAGFNVANLLLARSSARRREVAVRSALGASRARLMAELVAESVLLSIGAAALGLLLCLGGIHALKRLGAASVPRLDAIGVDIEVLAFTVIVALGAGIVFGLLPAWRTSRADLHDSLVQGQRGFSAAGSVWSRHDPLRRLLVAGELALSVVLLVGAGLLLRSFVRVQQVPPGFNPAQVLTFELTMAGRRYAEVPALLEAYRQLWQRLGALPGVSAAGAVSALPLSQMMAWGPITVEGRTPAPGEAFINTDIRVVAGDYFRAMEIPLLAGRLFTEHDTRDTDRVIVVDEALANQLWPGQDPLGKRVRSGGFDAKSDSPWLTVVGVVGRIKQDRLDADSRIALYHPHAQYPARAMNVTVRSRMDSAGLATAVRGQVQALDPDLPLSGLRTMTERVSASLARRRFAMLLLGLFALLALTLATIGTYGLIAYQVSQGTRELGIRLALGATPARVVRLVLREGLVLALAGLGAGLACASALTRAVRSLLFGIAPADPVTYVAVFGLLLTAALLASYLPARRAAAIDPVVSLRSE